MRQGSLAAERLPVSALRSSRPRNLTVVVSDCTGDAWRDGQMWEHLRLCARTAPTVLVNPLPTKLWRHLGIDLPAVRAGAPAAPGAANVELRVPATLAGPSAEPVAIPALSLSPRSLGQWARVLMRGSPERCDALLVAPRNEPREEAALPGGHAHEVSAVEGFRYLASPIAVRLAVLCSPFPAFTVELIQFVAEMLVPEATTADIAEFVGAGPVRLSRADDVWGSTVWIRFRPDARAELADMLGVRDAWRLHDAIASSQEYDEDEPHRPCALVADPPDHPDAPSGHRPLAEAAAYVLMALGVGETARSAESTLVPEATAPSVREESPPRSVEIQAELRPSRCSTTCGP